MTRFRILRRFSVVTLRRSSVVAGALALVLVRGLAGQGTPSPSLTMLSREGRRALPLVVSGDQELVGLDDLAGQFQLAVREETLGAITVTYKGKTIVLTPDQSLASVAGKLISLPAPPTRAGRRWLVPVEFISRALAPIYDVRLDLRKPSRLLVIGDLRVPRITSRYETVGNSVRVVIDATPRTNSTVSQDNDRISIRFDADALDIAPMPPFQPGGIVQGLRVLDAVSLAVELGPRFGAFRSSAQPLDVASRLVIDVAAAETAPPAPGVPPPAGGPTGQPAVPPSGQPPQPGQPTQPGSAPATPPDLGPPVSSIRTVAIDPGHGGDDDGVRGPAGTKEKDLTLAVARRVRSALEARLGIRVLLTRDDDRNVTLNDRAAAANNNKADVFVSLHANASLRKGTAGATIFYSSFEGGPADTQTAPAAERLPTFSGGLRDIELVPWDLAQIRYLDQSAELAKILEQEFHDRVPLAARAIDRAPLRVLESANMPAVVIEMGFLSNPDQERQLLGGEAQAAFAQAVVDAVTRFRAHLDELRRSTNTAAAAMAIDRRAASGAAR